MLNTHGTLYSPGSPGNYPQNRDCEWHLAAIPGKRLQLHFFTMQLENHDTCDNDFVAVSNTCGTSKKKRVQLIINEYIRNRFSTVVQRVTISWPSFVTPLIRNRLLARPTKLRFTSIPMILAPMLVSKFTTPSSKAFLVVAEHGQACAVRYHRPNRMESTRTICAATI